MGYMYGIDISKWQGKKGMQATLYPQNCEFVICKATEGTNIVDPSLKANMNIAYANGKLLGVYHYARPDINMPNDEAKHFYNTIKDYVGKCIICLDWECHFANSYPQTWAIQFLSAIYNLTGVKPFIYTSSSALSKIPLICETFPLWVADYTGVAGEFSYPVDKFMLHQYTNKPLDCDVFNGNKTDWLYYCMTDDEKQFGDVDIVGGSTAEQKNDYTINLLWSHINKLYGVVSQMDTDIEDAGSLNELVEALHRGMQEIKTNLKEVMKNGE